MKNNMSERGQALIAVVVIGIMAIVVYGLYVQATGKADFFGHLFGTLQNTCDALGYVKNSAGNCVAR